MMTPTMIQSPTTSQAATNQWLLNRQANQLMTRTARVAVRKTLKITHMTILMGTTSWAAVAARQLIPLYFGQPLRASTTTPSHRMLLPATKQASRKPG